MKRVARSILIPAGGLVVLAAVLWMLMVGWRIWPSDQVVVASPVVLSPDVDEAPWFHKHKRPFCADDLLDTHYDVDEFGRPDVRDRRISMIMPGWSSRDVLPDQSGDAIMPRQVLDGQIWFRRDGRAWLTVVLFGYEPDLSFDDPTVNAQAANLHGRHVRVTGHTYNSTGPFVVSTVSLRR